MNIKDRYMKMSDEDIAMLIRLLDKATPIPAELVSTCENMKLECPTCGSEIKVKDRYCSTCGQRIDEKIVTL